MAGLTFRLGQLPDALQTDASNNIGIGGSPSGSYKLEVTGTAKVSSTLLVGSTLTANDGTFSGSGVDGSLGSVVRISTTNTNGNARNWALVNTFDSYGDLNFRLSTAQGGNALTAGSTVLTLSRTGAATFSSSVSATKVILSLGSDQAELTSAFNNDFKLTNSGAFRIVNNANTVALFTINNSGSTTFSNVVTGNDVFSAYSGFRNYSGGAARGGMYTYATITGAGTDYSNTLFAETGYGIYFCPNGSVSRAMIIYYDNYIALNSVVFNNTASGTVRTLYMGNSNYLIGGISSIRASKKNIENVSNVNWLYQLTPVTFNYRKADKNKNYTEEVYDEINYGLIAEDTAPIADFLINYDEKENGNKEMIGIEYPRLIIPLLKAIQELNQQNQDLKSRLDKAGL